MSKPAQEGVFQREPLHWLSEELFLKLHLELTLLAIQWFKSTDKAEDIASQCLIDLWMTMSPGDPNFPIKPFLLKRLAELTECVSKEVEQQVAVEKEYGLLQMAASTSEPFIPKGLFSILRFLPLLEPSEQQVLRLLLEERLDLEQIAGRLQISYPKVKRLYKHCLFRLRKEMGQWKQYQ